MRASLKVWCLRGKCHAGDEGEAAWTSQGHFVCATKVKDWERTARLKLASAYWCHVSARLRIARAQVRRTSSRSNTMRPLGKIRRAEVFLLFFWQSRHVSALIPHFCFPTNACVDIQTWRGSVSLVLCLATRLCHVCLCKQVWGTPE